MYTTVDDKIIGKVGHQHRWARYFKKVAERALNAKKNC